MSQEYFHQQRERKQKEGDNSWSGEEKGEREREETPTILKYVSLGTAAVIN